MMGSLKREAALAAVVGAVPSGRGEEREGVVGKRLMGTFAVLSCTSILNGFGSGLILISKRFNPEWWICDVVDDVLLFG